MNFVKFVSSTISDRRHVRITAANRVEIPKPPIEHVCQRRLFVTDEQARLCF
ncbi:hypothetical protein DPMN_054813 [Dreissena polymorpha]|uniref:Uncharacterized protein n=1 Tax=Dreissena polymorpha TaxID=45954 RepID=A0A9D4CQ66_DREPO|nr:hypothetical protein DPMN_054813 [Dreissena polymorpha]